MELPRVIYTTSIKKKKPKIDIIENLYDLLHDIPYHTEIMDILLTLHYSDTDYPIDKFIDIIKEGMSFFGRPINDATNQEYQYYLNKAYRTDCPVIPFVNHWMGPNYELFNDWRERQALIAMREGLDFDYENGQYKLR